jgi:hypothetical protein
MKTAHCFKIVIFLSLALILCTGSTVFSEDVADDVLAFRHKVDDRYEGDDSESQTIMKLQKIERKKDGTIHVKAERIRKTERYTKAYGKDDKMVLFFLEPADVRGTGFLSYVYDDDDKDNDQWLYLPAMRKIRRIASGDKSGSFMGTDFSYLDISGIKVEKYNHRFLTQEDLKKLLKDKSITMVLKKKFGKSKEGFRNAKAWMTAPDFKVIESTPKTKETLADDGYSRLIDWVTPETLVIEKSIYFGKNKKAFKVKEVLDLQKIQNIWTEVTMTMENFRKNHRTIIEGKGTKYNTGLKDSYFTQRTLTEGL